MASLSQYLHVAVAKLERAGYLRGDLPRELVVAFALEVNAGRKDAAIDVSSFVEILRLLDAEAARVFGVATRETRAQIIKRELSGA